MWASTGGHLGLRSTIAFWDCNGFGRGGSYWEREWESGIAGKGNGLSYSSREKCKACRTMQNSPLLHICSPPPAINFHLISQLKSPPGTPLFAGGLQSPGPFEVLLLSQALSSTSSPMTTTGHFWTWPPERLTLTISPSPTHFPMHFQGDLSKSKCDSIIPFLIIFHELQITYSWGLQPPGYRPSVALLPEFCLLSDKQQH